MSRDKGMSTGYQLDTEVMFFSEFKAQTRTEVSSEEEEMKAPVLLGIQMDSMLLE